jgi:hypothetical protein
MTAKVFSGAIAVAFLSCAERKETKNAAVPCGTTAFVAASAV